MHRWFVLAVTLSCAPTQAPRASAPPPPAKPVVQPVQEERKIDPAEARKIGIAQAREKIDGARAALEVAVKAIKNKSAGEPEVTQARDAAAALRTALDEGSQYESGDLGYTKYSLEGRRSYRMQRDVVERRAIEIGVELGKRDIENALLELYPILDRIKSKDVADEDFNLARAGVEAVVAAVGRHQAIVSRNGKFASYVSSVKGRMTAQKKSLDDRQLRVSVDRQKERIEEGRRLIADAIAHSELEQAEQGIAATRKVLDEGKGLAAKDREYYAYAFQVVKRMDEAVQKIAAMRLAAEVKIQREKLGMAVADMKQSLQRLPMPEDVALAETAIGVMEKTLAEGQALAAKDSGYSWYASEAKKAGEAGRARIELRKLELAIAESKAVIEDLLAVAKTSAEIAGNLDATSKELTTAVSASAAVREAMAKGAALEQRDRRYASFVAWIEGQLEKLAAGLEAAKRMVAFREGPAAALIEGRKIADSVSASMGLEQKRDALTKSTARLSSCVKDGEAMMESDPRVASVGKEIVAECGALLETVDAKLSAVKATLAFYNGPAKSIEKAKALLAEEKQSEALSHFESCLETGKILAYKHPALSKEQFQVGGKTVTLPAVVADCQHQAKALRAKIQHAKK